MKRRHGLTDTQHSKYISTFPMNLLCIVSCFDIYDVSIRRYEFINFDLADEWWYPDSRWTSSSHNATRRRHSVKWNNNMNLLLSNGQNEKLQPKSDMTRYSFTFFCIQNVMPCYSVTYFQWANVQWRVWLCVYVCAVVLTYSKQDDGYDWRMPRHPSKNSNTQCKQNSINMSEAPNTDWRISFSSGLFVDKSIGQCKMNEASDSLWWFLVLKAYGKRNLIDNFLQIHVALHIGSNSRLYWISTVEVPLSFQHPTRETWQTLENWIRHSFIQRQSHCHRQHQMITHPTIYTIYSFVLIYAFHADCCCVTSAFSIQCVQSAQSNMATLCMRHFRWMVEI